MTVLKERERIAMDLHDGAGLKLETYLEELADESPLIRPNWMTPSSRS